MPVMMPSTGKQSDQLPSITTRRHVDVILEGSRSRVHRHPQWGHLLRIEPRARGFASFCGALVVSGCEPRPGGGGPGVLWVNLAYVEISDVRQSAQSGPFVHSNVHWSPRPVRYLQASRPACSLTGRH